MTQDEIIRMAREAGAFRNYFDYGVEGFAFVDDETLERFAALVAAHEREACAQWFENEGANMMTKAECAAAIQARSDKE